MKQVRKLQNTYISESIKNIDRLSVAVCQHLGINPEQHKLFVLPRRQEITLLLESPVFASQLRYQQQDILRFINKRFLGEFKEIRVKISPPVMPPPAPPKVHKPLPDDIKKMLSAVLDELDT
ncbi:MAG: hypothetical protein CSB48_00825 [Proteobacteria bacterium]|nr:MAG: hypothetical protein CSB48_00825 [Pseudomonadota bacterium]